MASVFHVGSPEHKAHLAHLEAAEKTEAEKIVEKTEAEKIESEKPKVPKRSN